MQHWCLELENLYKKDSFADLDPQEPDLDPLVEVRIRIRVHPFSHWRKESDPELDPDPLVRGMDPRIRTRTVTDSQHWKKGHVTFSVQKGRRRRRSCDVSCPIRTSPSRRSTWPTSAITRRQRQRAADTYKYVPFLFVLYLTNSGVRIRYSNGTGTCSM